MINYIKWKLLFSSIKLHYFIFINFLLFSSSAIASIELRTLVHNTNLKMIMVSGSIERGDCQRFEALVAQIPRALIYLQGPGGNVNEALCIGATIRVRSFSTSVMPEHSCFSACGLVWLSGVRRYMTASSQIGFHAAYRMESGRALETGMANAEIGSFLTHLGYSRDAIRFVTAAQPNDLQLLSLNDARLVGIDVYEQRGGEVIEPVARPSLHTLIDRAARLSGVAGRCAEYPSLDQTAAKRRTTELIEQQWRLAGRERSLELMHQAVESILAEMMGMSLQKWCAENIQLALRRGDMSTTTASPSFDCSRSRNTNERTICLNPDLAQLDRHLSEMYLGRLRIVPEREAHLLRKSQRAWLQSRNKCGGKADCLRTLYEDRITLLK